MGFTRYVGEDGVEGTRKVRKGGLVIFNHQRLTDKKLLPFVGDTVYCYDDSGYISINTFKYNSRFKRLYRGEWICTIRKSYSVRDYRRS